MRHRRLIAMAFAVFIAGCARETQAAQRAIVVLGSSTAEGAGARPYSQSWAGRLEVALAGQGFAVKNMSISGSSTGDSLARFDRDVTPYRPEFVILATAISNEPANAVPTFVRNTVQLIRRVEAIGATPIVVAPYPNNSFSAAMYASVKDIYRRLASEGVIILDFLDGGDDGHGHWLPGLDTDGTHPNNTGHGVLFDSIPLTIFSRLVQPAAWVNPHGFGSLTQMTRSEGNGALEVRPATAMGSWSASFWVKGSQETGSRVLVAINSDMLQAHRVGDELRITQGGLLLATATLGRVSGFQHVAMTYHSYTGMLRLYLNGAVQFESSAFRAGPALVFEFGGTNGRPDWNATGDSFADILLYRAPITAADVSDILKSEPTWKSVEAWMPLTHSPGRPSLNLAPTSVTTTVNGSWVWSSEGVGRILTLRRR